jgi:hypothetical protein
VSTQLDEWITAEVLKDEFTHNQSQRDPADTTAQLENEAEATIELSASFLVYVAESLSIAEDQSTHARTALIFNVFKYSTSTYPSLATKDSDTGIHSLTSTFDTDRHIPHTHDNRPCPQRLTTTNTRRCCFYYYGGMDPPSLQTQVGGATGTTSTTRPHPCYKHETVGPFPF